jgi:hypothetical protein
MEKPEARAQGEGVAQRPGTTPDATYRTEEILPWENIGDDLWLPRRVRGSFHGGALG